MRWYKEIILGMALAVGLGMTMSTMAADADINKVGTAPTIDGTIDAVWSGATAYPIDKLIHGEVTDDSDLAGTWKALWDDDNLYYLVVVSDDALWNDSGSSPPWIRWRDDSVEVFVDADYSHGTSYNSDDFQYNFRWNDTVVGYGANSGSDTTGITFAIPETGTNYVMEASIPWTTLNHVPVAGDIIGTGVAINDDDDGGSTREAQLQWLSTSDVLWSNPSLFPSAVLVSSSISGTVTYTGYAGTSALLTFELREPGTTTIIADAAEDEDAGTPGTQLTVAMSGGEGTYSLTGLPEDTYDVTVKMSGTLREIQTNVSVVGGSNTPNVDYTLRGGDANADNSVGVGDMYILRDNWGESGAN